MKTIVILLFLVLIGCKKDPSWVCVTKVNVTTIPYDAAYDVKIERTTILDGYGSSFVSYYEAINTSTTTVKGTGSETVISIANLDWVVVSISSKENTLIKVDSQTKCTLK